MLWKFPRKEFPPCKMENIPDMVKWNLKKCEVIKELPCLNFDALVKSQKTSFFVIPAKAGIQCFQSVMTDLDPGFRRGDDFLRDRQLSFATKSTYFIIKELKVIFRDNSIQQHCRITDDNHSNARLKQPGVMFDY